MSLPELSYKKVWTSTEDFPTYEGSEDQVRLDNQYHPDAIKDYINNVLLPTLEGTGAGEGAGSIGIFPVAGLPGAKTVQEALETFVDVVRSVTQGAVPDASIGTSKLIDASVTTDKLKDLAITPAKLEPNAVQTEKIAENAVTEEKLADNIVSEQKIKDGAISQNKIVSGAVDTSKLAPGSVTELKIAAGAVTTAKIGEGAITTDKLASGTVTTDKLASGTVTTEKLAAGAVGSEALKDASVTADKLSAEAITAGRLVFADVVAPAASSITTNTYADFPCRTPVKLEGVTSDMVPEVIFSVEDAMSGDFAPVAESYDGGVYIYSSEVPAASITIPVIILWR